MTATRSVTSDDIRVIICIVFDRRAAPEDVGAFKTTVLKCPSVLHAVEVSGAFDFMVEATIPDMKAYTAQLDQCAPTVARLISRYEVNFVCKRFVSADEERRSVWVPCQEGMVRIDCAKIDKVTAEGDYMGEAGVEELVEIGGKVLGPMVKRILPDAKVTSVISIEDIEALAKEIA